MSEERSIKVGDRVSVFLEPSRWRTSGWISGTVIRIDGYSAHRNFHWVELDTSAEFLNGGRLPVVSVINPKHIRGI
ncbi:MAG TPA: hypothetical protein VFH29_01505 [Anaerolineales bacterium]|nr:hypothetical protein [Anaerolineales bacterium]